MDRDIQRIKDKADALAVLAPLATYAAQTDIQRVAQKLVGVLDRIDEPVVALAPATTDGEALKQAVMESLTNGLPMETYPLEQPTFPEVSASGQAVVMITLGDLDELKTRQKRLQWLAEYRITLLPCPDGREWKAFIPGESAVYVHSFTTMDLAIDAAVARALGKKDREPR